MIRHIVMWRVAGRTAEERRETASYVKKEFESLRGVIPGLVALEVGIDVSAVDYACDVVLVTDFESRAALEAYADHPEHLRVREALTGMREARHQVDYYLH
ncbi:Dabb family protein [Paraburkholderia pallida]|uniref:Dabb family protein n=1 Tax=Paraburkholderia pallida TaxID=2547399 RepID=A0A4P7D424_9BURK|nr:Dabb family protein [Paraburkholderia pallida]QBR03531.1 Dabb family protein [Paraburkholderia pallida]